jgi:DNA-binding MarR family transcriptional regulator
VTSTQLGELMGTTKRAASKLLDSMVDGGYVERRTGTDGRERLIHLTRRGRRLLAAVEEIYTSIERGSADVIGEREVQRLRTSLTRVVTAGSEGVLPPVRPTW